MSPSLASNLPKSLGNAFLPRSGRCRTTGTRVRPAFKSWQAQQMLNGRNPGFRAPYSLPDRHHIFVPVRSFRSIVMPSPLFAHPMPRTQRVEVWEHPLSLRCRTSTDHKAARRRISDAMILSLPRTILSSSPVIAPRDPLNSLARTAHHFFDAHQ